MFETLKEAEQWARQTGLARDIVYTGAPGLTWGVDYLTDEQRLQKLNTICREWDRLRRVYITLRPGAIHTLYVTFDEQGRANMQGRQRHVSVADPLSTEDRQTYRLLEVRLGCRPNTQRPTHWTEDNFRHELGHVLTDSKILRRWRTQIESVYSEDWIRSSISDYATTETVEAIAETFALTTSPMYNAGTLPLRIESIVWTMLGR